MHAFFLSVIITQFKMGNWKATKIPTNAIHLARGSLNDVFPSNLTWNDVYKRFMLMENRFRTFKEVIAISETYWDLSMNGIIAVDGIWKRIFKKNELAKAYYHVGESEFDKLAILVASENIKVEHSKTVVIISDTTIPLKGGKNKRCPG
ncbi:uncharacterized protein LOC131026236 [Salvia miltiorrhiza]|uniref:uncharacterized protein LOC131026236 n=1 Tax=Salvia miltiorrhiza TaxID=226208 RepID=UPI0025AD9A87|nr:uncharacterized protein LOC131026236 [Salvia miltiorrhiza]